ncbi:MAG: activator-dependent family glycosyltransferase [Pseudonocardiaceae bacterium]
MKVLFTCLTHSTHWWPLVPMAWALRTAGHEVRVAGEPGLIDAITRTGLTALQVGGAESALEDPLESTLLARVHEEGFTHLREFDWAGRDRESWTWKNLLALESIVVPAHDAVLSDDAMLDDLVGFAREWLPDLVIWETYTLAGSITAQVVGAAHARLIAGPDITMRVRQEFLRQAARQPIEHRADPRAEWIDWTLERFGSPEAFDEDLVTGQWTIDSTAPSTRLDLGLETLSVRYIPHNGPAVVPGWLRQPAARSRICLTFGISEWITEWLPGDKMTDLLWALADFDIEVVATLTTAQREQLGEIPDNARVVDFAPLNDLLPSCAAVVHHGGIGTKCNAELHGVPQIILPFGVDTTVMAERIEEIGAGLSLPITELTAEGLREQVRRTLNEPSITEGARQLQREVWAQPSPNDVVPLLEKLTAEHRRHAANSSPRPRSSETVRRARRT